jgi:hypothetical protein
MSAAEHRSPNKLWRSNSIFNLLVLCVDPKLATGGSVVRISATRLLNTFAGDTAHSSLMTRIYFYLFILSVTSAGPYRT